MAYVLRSAFFIGMVFSLSPANEHRPQKSSLRHEAHQAAALAEAIRSNPELARAGVQLALHAGRASFPSDAESRSQLRDLVAQAVASSEPLLADAGKRR